MSYCDGGCLKEVIDKNKQNSTLLKECEILRYIVQILFGYEYIHGINIIHRDIKPENIFKMK